MTRLSRRDLLAAGGFAAAGSLGGCLLDNEQAGNGDVYIENPTSGESTVDAYIAPQSGGDPIIQARYNVPEDTALQFRGVIESGETYDIRAAIPDAPPEERATAVVQPCSDNESPDERVVSVRTDPEVLGIITWGCDESYSEREMEYLDASNYRESSIDGTVAAPANERETDAP